MDPAPPAPDGPLDGYRGLLMRVDAWFAGALSAAPGRMQCRAGCFDCCLGLFDISIADAALLAEGLRSLDPVTRGGIERRARALMERVYALRPALRNQAFLPATAEPDLDALIEAVGPERCVCLGDEGQCLLYAHRPVICRLGGAPVVDTSGAVVHPEGCFRNSVTREDVPRLAAHEIRGEEQRILEGLARRGGGGRTAEDRMFVPMAVRGDPEPANPPRLSPPDPGAPA